MIVENGTWTVIVSADDIAVASSDFTHDAYLHITGDFARGEKLEYAREIANRLNEWTNREAVSCVKEPQ